MYDKNAYKNHEFNHMDVIYDFKTTNFICMSILKLNIFL